MDQADDRGFTSLRVAAQILSHARRPFARTDTSLLPEARATATNLGRAPGPEPRPTPHQPNPSAGFFQIFHTQRLGSEQRRIPWSLRRTVRPDPFAPRWPAPSLPTRHSPSRTDTSQPLLHSWSLSCPLAFGAYRHVTTPLATDASQPLATDTSQPLAHRHVTAPVAFVVAFLPLGLWRVPTRHHAPRYRRVTFAWPLFDPERLAAPFHSPRRCMRMAPMLDYGGVLRAGTIMPPS